MKRMQPTFYYCWIVGTGSFYGTIYKHTDPAGGTKTNGNGFSSSTFSGMKNGEEADKYSKESVRIQERWAYVVW